MLNMLKVFNFSLINHNNRNVFKINKYINNIVVGVCLTNDANYNIGPGVKGAGVGEGELGEGLEEGLEGRIVKGGW